MAAVLVVCSLLVTQGVFASARQDNRGDFFVRLKHAIVKVLSEFGFPPG
jgi:hypothetical protein